MNNRFKAKYIYDFHGVLDRLQLLKKQTTYLAKKEVVKNMASSSEYNLTSASGSDTDESPTISEKKQIGFEDIFFENSLRIFHFFYYTPGISRQNKALHHKILLDPLEIPRPKAKTPGNFTSFLINPCKFHMLFL